MPSRSKKWDDVRTIEDALALLATIEKRRRIIRHLLWKEGDLHTAYVEATQMQIELAKLKEILSQHWKRLYSQAQEKD